MLSEPKDSDSSFVILAEVSSTSVTDLLNTYRIDCDYSSLLYFHFNWDCGKSLMSCLTSAIISQKMFFVFVFFLIKNKDCVCIAVGLGRSRGKSFHLIVSTQKTVSHCKDITIKVKRRPSRKIYALCVHW